MISSANITHIKPADTPIKHIRVISPSYENCLVYSNVKYSDENLVKSACGIIKHIQDQSVTSKVHEIIVMTGSGRQSVNSDKWASDIRSGNPNTGSVFPAMHAFSKILEKTMPSTLCRQDTFIMSNLYKMEDFNKDYPKEVSPGWVYDHSRITILYAQMHKIASENRDAKITFEFYDYNIKRLEQLKRFFSDNPLLIPRNVSLCLNRYNNASASVVGDNPAKIDGTGIIDNNYVDSVKLMAELCGNKRPFSHYKEIFPEDSVRWFTVEVIDKFKQVRMNAAAGEFLQSRTDCYKAADGHDKISIDVSSKVQNTVLSTTQKKY